MNLKEWALCIACAAVTVVVIVRGFHLWVDSLLAL